jgi:hypothetical protein
MKTSIIFVFICLLLSSCYHKNETNISEKRDSVLVDSIYVEGTWERNFHPITTPLGGIIKHKITNDTSYVIEWGKSSNMRTFPDTFRLDGHDSWMPRFIAENKNYIVLKAGCGNPCWTGYFLPIDKSIKPQKYPEYLYFDLDNHLVVYIKESDIIEIINLKTGKNEYHKLGNCESVFPGYCIDSLSIKNKTLRYKWIPETTIYSNKGNFKLKKLIFEL